MTKKKTTEKHHRGLITTLIIIIALGIFYAWGSFYYQRDRQIDRIIVGLEQPNRNIVSYVQASNPDMEVTNAKLKPLQRYFRENKNAAKTLGRNLRRGKDSDQIQLVEDGRYFLVFPKYRIRVRVYIPQVETNNPKSTLYVNGQNYGRMEGADQNFYQDLGMVFPGRYHLAVNTKVQGRKLKASSVTNIWSNRTVNMTIKTGTFQIRSVPEGMVYINDRRVKRLDKNGQAVFKNYPLSKDMELYIETKYNGIKICSYKVKDLSSSIESEFSKSDDDVSDYANAPSYNGNEEDDVYQDIEGDYIVNPLWPGLIDKNEAEKILTQSYTKTVDDAFEKGKDNAEYKALKKTVKEFAKSKAHLKIEAEVTKILPAGKNYSEVSYQLVYKYRHKGKKYRKTIDYQNAIFHKVGDKQLIQKLGTKVN